MAIPFIPLRRSTRAAPPLPVVMSGVRRGERVLQIGVDDAAIAGAIAATVGVNGRAAFAVTDEAAAATARKAAENAMALADVELASLPALPFPDATFDLVVFNARKGALATLDAPTLARLLGEVHRVLRDGGRLVAMQAGTPDGITAWLRSAKPATGPDIAGSLSQGGFRAVRVLADREGYLFTEGLRAKG
jgi:SAM-dependent methyltransferase